MDLKCEHVWREISNYLDNDLDPSLQSDMTAHIDGCSRCKSVLDGMRNVVSLYRDPNLFAPAGDFDRRLHGWLADRVEGRKGSWWGWVAATAFAGAAAALILITSPGDGTESRLRAQMSQPARQIQQQLVAVVDGGKLFHDPRCSLIHGKYHMVTPAEAIREGYTPCTRCLDDDLQSAQQPGAKPGLEVGENHLSPGISADDQ